MRCGSLVKIVEGAKTEKERKAGVKVGMGALEVQIAVRFFDDVPAKVGVIFSKLQLRTFPSSQNIQRAVVDFVKRAGVPTAELADEERENGAPWASDSADVPWAWASDHRPAPDHELVVPTFDEFVDKQREAGNETFANAFTFEEERRARRRRSPSLNRSPEPEPEPQPEPEPEPEAEEEEDAASYGDDFAGEDDAAPEAEEAEED